MMLMNRWFASAAVSAAVLVGCASDADRTPRVGSDEWNAIVNDAGSTWRDEMTELLEWSPASTELLVQIGPPPKSELIDVYVLPPGGVGRRYEVDASDEEVRAWMADVREQLNCEENHPDFELKMAVFDFPVLACQTSATDRHFVYIDALTNGFGWGSVQVSEPRRD